MRLFEYEGKQLLGKAGVAVPEVIAVDSLDSIVFSEPCVLKAQVLFGNRWKKGLIQPCLEKKLWPEAVKNLRAALRKNKLTTETKVLVEPLVKFGQEMYLALRYDTHSRLPVLNFDPAGGSGIEERAGKSQLQEFSLEDGALSKPPAIHAEIHQDWLKALIDAFFTNDLTLLEINPLVLYKGAPLALDAKVELEDTAAFRHPEWQEYPPRSFFQRQPTKNELAAKTVNAMDHRGAAGASYFDLPGTIGILASGGGASQLAMDALLASGLEPANYTEYSGNPPREKVKALADIVLSNPKLEGLWVVGGHANFTDIYETLMGVFDAIENADLPPGFPVVIRRGGPRTEEAYSELRRRTKKSTIKLELFDSQFPLTDTVPVLQKMVEEFRKAR